MNDSTNKQEKFFGTYFDRDNILRLSRWADVLAWIILTIYMLGWIFSLLLFISQMANGMFFDKGNATFLNIFGMFKPYLTEPAPGVFYFFGLQAISKGVLILLDVEDNTRRAARK